MGTTVKVVGSMVILVILFGLVSCDSGVTPTLTTPTPSSVITTPEDSNVTCCDTILLSTTDDHYFFTGTWSLYTSNPSLNGRKVYKMRNSCVRHDNPVDNYCLYWSSNAWRVSDCFDMITSDPISRFYSSATSKKCPHGGDLVWQWSSTSNFTMKFSCMTGCSSPPTTPSDRFSNWDGSTMTAGPGTVVTYTCSMLPYISQATICDPQSLQWSFLSSFPACESYIYGLGNNTSAPVTTTPATVTTTTEQSPINATTYPNVTCCDNVLLSSTDTSFIEMNGNVYFAGIYSLYKYKPSLNGRKVYRLNDCDHYHQCLYWSSNAWKISPCNWIDVHIRHTLTQIVSYYASNFMYSLPKMKNLKRSFHDKVRKVEISPM